MSHRYATNSVKNQRVEIPGIKVVGACILGELRTIQVGLNLTSPYLFLENMHSIRFDCKMRAIELFYKIKLCYYFFIRVTVSSNEADFLCRQLLLGVSQLFDKINQIDLAQPVRFLWIQSPTVFSALKKVILKNAKI